MENYFCVGIPIFAGILLFLVMWIIIDEQNKKQKRIKDAADQYYQALSILKDAPDDTEARQEALRLGRRYADLARKYKRTTFDEVALMNDLNAIQPTMSAKPIEDDKTTDSDEILTDSVEQRLAKLAQLHSKDLITDEEYQERRSAILDEI